MISQGLHSSDMPGLLHTGSCSPLPHPPATLWETPPAPRVQDGRREVESEVRVSHRQLLLFTLWAVLALLFHFQWLFSHCQGGVVPGPQGTPQMPKSTPARDPYRKWIPCKRLYRIIQFRWDHQRPSGLCDLQLVKSACPESHTSVTENTTSRSKQPVTLCQSGL
jgi:hypothetical protein